MRILLPILFAFLLSVSAVVSATPSSPCCQEAPCEMAECIDMGCLQAASAIASLPHAGWAGMQGSFQFATEPVLHLPVRIKEIWTPPD